MQLFCGILGPDTVGTSRRLRSLGIAGAVRRFNERAVPGMGGVWFGKQLMLALLGVRVAELQAGRGQAVAKMECANAVEALACWLAYRDNGWISDPRLRGRNKFPRERALVEGPLYARFRARSFYVAQPMRMAVGSALVPLGFATSSNSRFNSLQSTPEGCAFLDAALRDCQPAKRSMAEHLSKWVLGEPVKVTTDTVARALSPCLPLPGEALEHLRDRLLAGGVEEPVQAKARRRAALAWVDRLQRVPPADPLNWSHRPSEIPDDRHWEDLEAGARLLTAREMAEQLLDTLEARIAHAPRERLTIASAVPAVREQSEALHSAAAAFLQMRHEDAEANQFCRDCSEKDPALVLRNLAKLDGRVVALAGDTLQPGTAFRRSSSPSPLSDRDAGDEPFIGSEESGVPAGDSVNWPKGMSSRMQNLYLLNLELNGKLHVRFASQEATA